MTPQYTAFYANKLYGEGNGFRSAVEVPDGAYCRVNSTGKWYHVTTHDWQEIALHDMTPEMQAIALIYFS